MCQFHSDISRFVLQRTVHSSIIDLNCQSAVRLALVIKLLVVTAMGIFIFYLWQQFKRSENLKF
jgi:hypothetical protein